MDEGNGRFRIEFTTVEVGSYVIDVTVKELTVPNSPLIAKAYDAGLIKVTDIQDGVVGDLSTFRVDASKAGIKSWLLNHTTRPQASTSTKKGPLGKQIGIITSQ